MSGNEPTIEYSVRELIERVEHKLDQFIDLMNSKADRTHVARIEDVLHELGTRVAAIEHTMNREERKAKESRDYRRWLVPTILTAVFTVASVVILFL